MNPIGIYLKFTWISLGIHLEFSFDLMLCGGMGAFVNDIYLCLSKHCSSYIIVCAHSFQGNLVIEIFSLQLNFEVSNSGV